MAIEEAKLINNDPVQAQDAGKALMQRAMEILEVWEDESSLGFRIWHNMGFHMATGVLLSSGGKPPIGNDAYMYIALVLAAAEHDRAGQMLNEAAREATP